MMIGPLDQCICKVNLNTLDFPRDSGLTDRDTTFNFPGSQIYLNTVAVGLRLFGLTGNPVGFNQDHAKPNQILCLVFPGPKQKYRGFLAYL